MSGHQEAAARAALAMQAGRRPSPADMRLVAEGYSGLVSFRARRLIRRCRSLEFADLVQHGHLAILRSLETYDPALAEFATYASWWIRSTMMRAIEEEDRDVRHPSGTGQRWQRLSRLMQERGELSTEELAAAAAMRPDTVAGTLASRRGSVSLDCVIDETGHTLGDVLPHPGPLAPDMLDDHDRETQAHRLLDSLPARERAIVHARIWRDQTLEAVGARFGLSRERIRQLEGSAIRALRVRAGVVDPPRRGRLDRPRRSA